MKSDEEIGRELPRIIDFIHRYVLPGEQVVVPVQLSMRVLRFLVLSFPSQEGWILMWWHGCVRWRWAGNV